MIERAFVHVGGSPGSGKTTFIETMLAGAGPTGCSSQTAHLSPSLAMTVTVRPWRY